MKIFILSAIFTALLLSAGAQGQTPSRADLQQTLVHQAQLGRELAAKFDSAQKKLSDSEKSRAEVNAALDSARQQLDQANQRVLELNSNIASLTKWGVDQQTRANIAEVALTKEKEAHQATLDRYHKLKLIAALVVGVLALLASLQLAPLVPLAGPYGAILPVAAGAAGFSLIWFFL